MKLLLERIFTFQRKALGKLYREIGLEYGASKSLGQMFGILKESEEGLEILLGADENWKQKREVLQVVFDLEDQTRNIPDKRARFKQLREQYLIASTNVDRKRIDAEIKAEFDIIPTPKKLIGKIQRIKG